MDEDKHEIQDLEIDYVKLAADEEMVRTKFSDKIKTTIGKIPFTIEALSAYYCAIDPKTSMKAKALLMGALAYFILPADIIPDVLAGVGFTDDAAVLLAVLKILGDNIKETHKAKASEFLRQDN